MSIDLSEPHALVHHLQQHLHCIRSASSSSGPSPVNNLSDVYDYADHALEVCDELAAALRKIEQDSAATGAQGEAVAYLRTDLAPDGSNCGRELQWTTHAELWPERAARGFSVRIDPLYTAPAPRGVTDGCAQFARDVLEHGLRCDMNPTHDMPSLETAEQFWREYIRRIESELRKSAKAALASAPGPTEAQWIEAIDETVPHPEDTDAIVMLAHEKAALSASTGEQRGK